MRLRKIIESALKNRKWRRLNTHNRTYLGDIVERIDCISVGNATYGEINLLAANSNYQLKVGNFCSIARKTMFVLSAEHRTDFISTFPMHTYLNGINDDAESKGSIIIGDDVWIGYNTIIMSGVNIGQGAVIGAGSIVTNDIPPYAIAVGVPARVVKYRFSQEIINKLLKIDYSRITENDIRNNLELFSTQVNELTNVDSLPLKKE